MKNVFLDTNVLLDVLIKRQPHYEASAEIWTLCEENKLRGMISVISFNNIFYVARKLRGRKTAMDMLQLMRGIFEPIALDAQGIHQAIDAGFADFEDAIQFHCALEASAECLITRNAGDFPKSSLAVLTPEEFLAARETIEKGD